MTDEKKGRQRKGSAATSSARPPRPAPPPLITIKEGELYDPKKRRV